MVQARREIPEGHETSARFDVRDEIQGFASLGAARLWLIHLHVRGRKHDLAQYQPARSPTTAFHRLDGKALRQLGLAQREEALRGFAGEKGSIKEPAPR